MIRITLLGKGTPILEPERQASALLVEIGEDKLLFDAGRGVTTHLATNFRFHRDNICAQHQNSSAIRP